ncbi:hypothetical protein HMPREF1624_04220 [Sporothrix schenckii ATCC 58251]|uniref:glucan endo-1,3-beta-D-glucosidase n=1 Tax=Sporothrix schenckii (strain ATCC 58251 / de Perez 2211183) TaxID=1391915 RepID=U7PX39_SPOS1|nr:hypothetical protein HMPREF1624_04220 [Sporothrix schenckii ATCC 58251]
MPRKYSFESSGPDEQEPLDNTSNQRSPGSRRLQTTQPHQQHIELEQHEPYYDEPPQAPVYQQPAQASPRQDRQQHNHYPPSSSRTPRNPVFHPDSAYHQLAAQRQLGAAAPLRTTALAGGAADIVSPISPPAPPPHGGTRQPLATPLPPPSNITPGADNFSESAAGGMAGIAYSVADRNPRESGVAAMSGMQQPQQQEQQQMQQNYQGSPPPGYPQHTYQAGPYPSQQQQQQQQQQYRGYNGPYDQPEQSQPSPQMLRPAYGGSGGRNVDRDSRSSLQGLGGAAYPPGAGTPGTRTPSRSPHGNFGGDVYTDNPYNRYSMHDTSLGYVNPNEIEDDGDDGLEYGRSRNARTSMLSLAGYSTKSSRSGTASGAVGPAAVGAAAVGAAAVGAAAAGPAATAALAHGNAGEYSHAPGMGGSPDGLMGDRVASSNGARYNALNDGHSHYAGGGGSGGGYDSGAYNNLGRSGGVPEKSEWLTKQSHSKKIWKWAIIIGIALAVIAGVVLGVVFGVVLKKKDGSGGGSNDSSGTASGDTNKNGDLDINSPEIQKLLNNKNLHKIFPGVDYTPINTQFPDCLANPPSQNNVTRDIAVLSQLTNTIRLYGTDCNQTEMAIHAINQLKLQGTVKIWMGVWQDNNQTTNARQLAQMWDILDKFGADPFKGIIVANEILFRQQMTTSQLSTLLQSVRTNMSSMSISLPVATSDLGTVWDAELSQASDYVMANIHPFFGGVNANDAAAWTWNFWETNNGAFFKSDKSKNIISETGWPSEGGTDCGSGSTLTVCPDAAVAGISQINTFLSTWVCDALTNGTEYFWFEAFDEPWKIQYDSGDQNWEDHWGIMDVNRNLKPGIVIPDCGGTTV